MIDLANLTITKAHEAMKSSVFSARELAQAYLDVVTAKNPEINAYLETYSDVLTQADAADARFKAGAATLLTGIPFAVKDNILIEGRVATAASKILENYHATYDATAIKKLKDQGVVFIGRANMDEFAMGGSTEKSAYGPTRNPRDTTRVPGGSSGGSVAAVAMDGALVSLGSDTGGSVRQPASFCGVVGLKPTYGAVSRHGLMAMGSSLDQIGPIGKTVEDVEIIFNAIKGKDIMDSTTIDSSDTTPTYPQRSLKGKAVIGVPRHFLKGDGIDAEVFANFEQTLARLAALGYTIQDVQLPNIKYSLAAYYVVMPAEVSSNMARFDGVKYGLHKDGTTGIEDYFITRAEGLGEEVRRRILLGTYVLSSGYYDAFYNKANIVRKLITEDFTKAFEHVDVIMTPTTPSPAFKIGEKNKDPLSMYLEDIFTVTANLTGCPAISIPSGTVLREGKQLPLGIQFTAPHGNEQLLFAVGKDFTV